LLLQQRRPVEDRHTPQLEKPRRPEHRNGPVGVHGRGGESGPIAIDSIAETPTAELN